MRTICNLAFPMWDQRSRFSELLGMQMQFSCTLQMFTGVYGKTLYSSKGKIVYVVGKPCNIYRLREYPIVTKGFSS